MFYLLFQRADNLKISFNINLHQRIFEMIIQADTIDSIGNSFRDRFQVVLIIGVLNMTQEFGSFPGEEFSSPK